MQSVVFVGVQLKMRTGGGLDTSRGGKMRKKSPKTKLKKPSNIGQQQPRQPMSGTVLPSGGTLSHASSSHTQSTGYDESMAANEHGQTRETATEQVALSADDGKMSKNLKVQVQVCVIVVIVAVVIIQIFHFKIQYQLILHEFCLRKF